MSLKRARSNSYGNYNQVSQSQGYGYMPRSSSKSTGKLSKKKPFKKITKEDINRAISRRLENKVTCDFASNQTINPAAVGSPPTTRYLLPILGQGLGQGNRIGNQIHVRSGKLCLFINCNRHSGNMINSPLMVRVWVLSYKLVNSNTVPAFTSFFQTGSGTAGFQENMLDMLLPVNKDSFTVYFDQTYKIGLGSVLASNIDTTNNLDNSSFNHRIDVDWGSHFKQVLDYNDSDNVPTNRNLFVVFQAIRADGAATVSDNDSGAEYHLTNTVYYEDG